MQAKDYYKILELSASATLKEIKLAYRRLAHQYHPDKNNNDPYAAAQFEIIKEAYEVLSNPAKKEHYLQQRWYDQSVARRQSTTAITPVTILKRLLELDKFVSTLDVHRMDKEGLFAYINDVVSEEIIKKLNTFDDRDINRAIIDTALKATHPLSHPQLEQLSGKLRKIRGDQASEKLIDDHLSRSRQSAAWTRYRLWLVILIVVILSLFIYYFSR